MSGQQPAGLAAGWVPVVVTLAMDGAEAAVPGAARGPESRFAAHRTMEPANCWRLTHRASGFALPICFGDLEDALAAADRIEGLPGWADVRRDGATSAMVPPELQARMRELCVDLIACGEAARHEEWQDGEDGA